MSRLVLVFPLLAVCLAQVSVFYVNKVPIHGKVSSEQKYTYFVDDNHDSDQLSYPTDIKSVGSLYEDDYTPDTTTCTRECPKLRKLYAYVNKAGSTITNTRIIDSSMKTATVTGKTMGFVAPYPGYCTSDDSTPIIELFSANLNTYAYWSPANPNQYVTLSNTTLDKSRWTTVRLVGYALPASPTRHFLSNVEPDYMKPIGKANYTHSFLPATEVVQLNDGNKWQVIGKPSTIDAQMTSNNMKFAGSLKIFLMSAAITAGEVLGVEKLCGSRIMIWSSGNTDRSSIRLTSANNPEQTGYKPMSISGSTWAKNSTVCGGLKGMGKLTEFQHKTNANRFTYAIEPTEIAALKSSSEWTPTNLELGYVSRDTIGFTLFNGVLTVAK